VYWGLRGGLRKQPWQDYLTAEAHIVSPMAVVPRIKFTEFLAIRSAGRCCNWIRSSSLPLQSKPFAEEPAGFPEKRLERTLFNSLGSMLRVLTLIFRKPARRTARESEAGVK
jgi:hypothetical protein